MTFLDLARDRYSERRFVPTPVEDDKLELILEAARLAPTAENKQPQRICLVRSPEGLAKVDEATRCRFGAPAVLILAYDMTVAARHPDVCDFGVVDLGIVGTHAMLQAAELGVYSCWVGLIDPSELRRQFAIPPTWRVVSVMPLGYPSEKSRPSRLHRRRADASELFFDETFETPHVLATADAGSAQAEPCE